MLELVLGIGALIGALIWLLSWIVFPAFMIITIIQTVTIVKNRSLDATNKVSDLSEDIATFYLLSSIIFFSTITTNFSVGFEWITISNIFIYIWLIIIVTTILWAIDFAVIVVLDRINTALNYILIFRSFLWLFIFVLSFTKAITFQDVISEINYSFILYNVCAAIIIILHLVLQFQSKNYIITSIVILINCFFLWLFFIYFFAFKASYQIFLLSMLIGYIFSIIFYVYNKKYIKDIIKDKAFFLITKSINYSSAYNKLLISLLVFASMLVSSHIMIINNSHNYLYLFYFFFNSTLAILLSIYSIPFVIKYAKNARYISKLNKEKSKLQSELKQIGLTVLIRDMQVKDDGKINFEKAIIERIIKSKNSNAAELIYKISSEFLVMINLYLVDKFISQPSTKHLIYFEQNYNNFLREYIQETKSDKNLIDYLYYNKLPINDFPDYKINRKTVSSLLHKLSNEYTYLDNYYDVVFRLLSNAPYKEIAIDQNYFRDIKSIIENIKPRNGITIEDLDSLKNKAIKNHDYDFLKKALFLYEFDLHTSLIVLKHLGTKKVSPQLVDNFIYKIKPLINDSEINYDFNFYQDYASDKLEKYNITINRTEFITFADELWQYINKEMLSDDYLRLISALFENDTQFKYIELITDPNHTKLSMNTVFEVLKHLKGANQTEIEAQIKARILGYPHITTFSKLKNPAGTPLSTLIQRAMIETNFNNTMNQL